MNLSTRLLSVCIVLLAATIRAPQGAAQSVIPSTSPIEATLVIPDNNLLPGVPFDMWIEVRNPSDSTVGLGLCGDMLVTPEGREPFEITFGGGEGRPAYPVLLPDDEWRGGRVRYLPMKPRSTVTLTMPVRYRLGADYFIDHRLSAPGRYRISFRLDYCWPGFTTPQKQLLPPDFLGAVTTREVVVTRVTPTGADARVWQHMQDITGGKLVAGNWPIELVRAILTDHRDSAYFPYAVVGASFGTPTEKYLPLLQEAIQRYPDTPVIDMLQQHVLGITRASCGTKASTGACERAKEKLNKSKRPTTRIIVFGREDAPPPVCPPEYDCE